MKFMLTLHGDEPGAAIDSYLAALGDTGVVLGSERLAAQPGVVISEIGDAPAVVVRDDSAIRAIWILGVPSRAAAVAIARGIPGSAGVVEVRETFTSEDFGGPPEPEVPQPAPPRLPGTTRYIALLRSDAYAEGGAMPTESSTVQMDAYCGELMAGSIMVGGMGLKPSAKGTRVRRSAAQRFVLDGPFTESKELVAGYMIVQAKSLDEAVDHIRPWVRIHRTGQGVPSCAIEVRALVG